MKYRLWLCLLVAMGWIYTLPQIYAGRYTPLVGNALHWASATAIYVTCAIALWVLLIRGRWVATVWVALGLVVGLCRNWCLEVDLFSSGTNL
ncbi:hypothetical protein OVA03_14625 [Asticcacaulis sp. SL142]|uniref:hypothetical protein n=1 Tax=Asticcacaulis sp. SL142 TaxID=2995155 RepID=UPI00226C7CC4|nr:hypothetical protein [Asticcacaulis sp. SL142]WAC47921.1 hypothetical protein OVA03_14625 [Asticcacaulis sp. SL142]